MSLRMDASRWWVYQRERFPLLRTGALVFAFSFSAVSVSGFLRGRVALPSLAAVAVSFVTSLGFFALLRIADEHKDFAEDSQFRAYRPVPRGLVKLSELRLIGYAIALVQVLAALLYEPRLLILLALAYAYFGLMTAEFFAHAWLKARPMLYLVSHMLIMPLLDLYATACDWLHVTGSAPAGLGWFLLMSFFNGIVIEVGRKLRAEEDEETGVETYTALYGRPRAVAGWLVAMVCANAAAVMVALAVHAVVPATMVFSLAFGISIVAGIRFLRSPSHRTASVLEPLSGVWVLASYLALALLPLVVAR